MSLDCDASDRTFDRQLAHLGLLDDAAPLFREGASVPGTGALLAVPCLVQSGLFRISRKLYGEIGPAFYGLRTTLLTLLLMALLRIKRPEHLKERDPAAFGRLLGLDRAPEVKTLWRRLTRLAAHHCAEQLGAELARLRVDQRGHLMGFLYVDGHVRAYHGHRIITAKAYVPRRHLAMPASTDYWINDHSGDPLLVITGEVDAALTKALPRLLSEVRDLVGARRVLAVPEGTSGRSGMLVVAGWLRRYSFRSLKGSPPTRGMAADQAQPLLEAHAPQCTCTKPKGSRRMRQGRGNNGAP
jgi:Transposase protein